jgi:hypothetical protein
MVVLVYPEEARFYMRDTGRSLADIAWEALASHDAEGGTRVSKVRRDVVSQLIRDATHMPKPKAGAGVFPDVVILDFKTKEDRMTAGVALEALARYRPQLGGKIEMIEHGAISGVVAGIPAKERNGDPFCWSFLMPLYHAHVMASEPAWAVARAKWQPADGALLGNNWSQGWTHTRWKRRRQLDPPFFVRHASLALLGRKSDADAEGPGSEVAVFCVWDEATEIWKPPGGAADRSRDCDPLGTALREFKEEANPLRLKTWKGPSRSNVEGRVNLVRPRNMSRQCEALFWAQADPSFCSMIARREGALGYCAIPLPKAYATRSSNEADLAAVHQGRLRFVEHRFCAFVALSELQEHHWARQLRLALSAQEGSQRAVQSQIQSQLGALTETPPTNYADANLSRAQSCAQIAAH